MWLVAVWRYIVSDCMFPVARFYLRNYGFVPVKVFFLIAIVTTLIVQ